MFGTPRYLKNLLTLRMCQISPGNGEFYGALKSVRVKTPFSLKRRQGAARFFCVGEILLLLAQTQSLFEFAPRGCLIAFARERHS
jgi:hypothetical protein